MAFGQVYDELTKFKTLFGYQKAKPNQLYFCNLFWWLETTKYNLNVN